MEDYKIIGWPDIQYFMDLEGWEENSALIEPNERLGIGSSTYLVSKEWLKSLSKQQMKEKCTTKDLGTVKLNQKAYVTDPCYGTLSWGNKLLNNIYPGSYRAFAVILDEGSWGHRVSELHVIREDIIEKYKDLEEIPYSIEPLDSVIGVDSGQCGIFDADYYAEHQLDSSWYSKICKLTDNIGGTIDSIGVVVASGYGDGGYSLYTVEEDGKTIAMKVIFIDKNEEDLNEE